MCYLVRYRGYHIAARRYKIYLRLLNNISRVSTANESVKYFFNSRSEISYIMDDKLLSGQS